MANSGRGNRGTARVKDYPLALDRFFDANPDLHVQLGVSQQAPSLGNIGRMLARSIEQSNPDAYSLILQAFLIKNGLKPPRGVFRLELTAGRPGRPRNLDMGFSVWCSYNSLNDPTFGRVAKELFPDEFSKNEKRTSDRVRQLYRSFEKLLPILEPSMRERFEAFRAWLQVFESKRENLKTISSQRLNRD